MANFPYCSFDPDDGVYVFDKKDGVEAKVMEEMQAVSVHFHTGGTGIVLDDKHVATDAHVALNSRLLQVDTKDGPLNATIEKLDVIGDMAILNVPGLERSGARPARFKLDGDPAAESKGFAFGYPEETGRGVPCIAHGSLEKRVKYSDLLSFKSLGLPFGDLYYSQVSTQDYPFLTAHADTLLPKLNERTAIPLRDGMHVPHGSGMSGGPMADGQADVIGMNFMADDRTVGKMLAVPARTVLDFAAQPSLFHFVYDGKNRLQKVEALKPENTAEAEMGNLILKRRSSQHSK